MNKQMDMHLFHELLWDESADDQLIIALKKMLRIEQPEAVKQAFKGQALGVWSGWSL